MDGGTTLGSNGPIAQWDDEGCAFILDNDDGSPMPRKFFCGAERRAGSPYCAHHHALCHVAEGSVDARRQLRTTEALATAVGGRRGRSSRNPPERFLRRLENLARGVSRPKCSCIVLGEK
ncbi:MAG TPA: hypothetical protein VET89_01375 [Stellaceae bacterium]|nr:hypothetical protein [Stellaceae bacterium]